MALSKFFTALCLSVLHYYFDNSIKLLLDLAIFGYIFTYFGIIIFSVYKYLASNYNYLIYNKQSLISKCSTLPQLI